LGVVVHDEFDEPRFSVLIRRNTKLPARATDTYIPKFDQQACVDLKVIEGDPEKPVDDEENVVLKNWEVSLLEPRRPVEDAAFSVTYEYNVDGILHVNVVDNKTRTVMMDDELTFVEGEKAKRLRDMRRRVDRLMLGGAPAGSEGGSGGRRPLSDESVTLVRRAREKMLPFVSDSDRKTLLGLIDLLESAAPAEEATRRDALQHEMRNHAYLV